MNDRVCRFNSIWPGTKQLRKMYIGGKTCLPDIISMEVDRVNL